MKLKDLLKNIDAAKLYGNREVQIKDIADDSRKVKKGSLFVAIPGLKNDGHDYIDQAVSKGAVAVIGQNKPRKSLKASYVQVRDSRKALSMVAQNFFNNPAKKLKLIGVTGTDGKTTTVSMIYHILRKSAKYTAMISTVEAKFENKKTSTGLHVTNPEPLVLQKLLAEFADKGAKHVVLETTSHGIDQKRVYGLNFEISAFTNLSREHLDYHKSMENYAATKMQLLRNSKLSVINIDDKYGKKFKTKLGSKAKTYSLKQKADYQGKILDNKFVVEHQGKEYWSDISMSGDYNYYNLLAAVSICNQLGVSIDKSLTAAKSFKFPAGRREYIKNNKGLNIIIDFAHTPNAVKNILSSVRTKGRLLCLVSAEGERDSGKREKIAQVASKYSDYVVLNPIDTRSESPAKIGEQMRSGAKITMKNNYDVILDRVQAINHLLKKAKKGDAVILLGKGHEQSMNIGGVEHPWSDKNVVEQALKDSPDFHFMGIGGSGSNAAASLAADADFNVSGCNIEVTSYLNKIKNKIKNIQIGHSPQHLSKDTVLVVSPSILFSNANHPEVKAAKKVITWQEFVGKHLQKDKKVIAVAGTHGKSTTTAMAGEVFEDAGADPTVLVGASVARWHGNARSGNSELFIIEADEFNDNYLHYSPETIILNNIEFDHPDFFKNYAQIENSFAKFIKNLKGAKNLIINQDSLGVDKLLKKNELSKNIKLYGYTLGEPKVKLKNSLTGEIVERSSKGTKFKVGKIVYSTSLPGDYNVANALSVILLAQLYDLDTQNVKNSLASFSGIGRRMELKYSNNKLRIYDDYAHHPTAVRETLKALKQKYPDSRLLCIIEPHSFSRTKKLLKHYKNALGVADKAIIGPIFNARDSRNFGISEQSIVKVSNHRNIESFSNLEKMLASIKKDLNKFNLIVVMGAGNSHHWTQEIINNVKK